MCLLTWLCGPAGERDLYQLADLLNVRVTEVTDRTTLLARLFPRCYHSRPSVLLRRVVRHRSVRQRSHRGHTGHRLVSEVRQVRQTDRSQMEVT